MRRAVQYLFRPFVKWVANRLSASPDTKLVHSSLTRLFRNILKLDKHTAGILLDFGAMQGRYIIFSDQHKGARDDADDFAVAEHNYNRALHYYADRDFQFINLGDSEEFWENKVEPVLEKNQASLAAEKRFADGNRMLKVFGNHDLFWKDDFSAPALLKKLFGRETKVYEGIILRTQIKGETLLIFLTHGHQGDKHSDGNRLSRWVVRNIWAPVQGFFEVNINTPASDYKLRDRHNIMMYEWSRARQNTILITGHTHKPVFASQDHLSRLYYDLNMANEERDDARIEKINAEIALRLQEYGGTSDDYMLMKKPSYFNTGCCCFADGDITGIEIADGFIRLVKWTAGSDEPLVRQEASLEEIFNGLT